MKFVPITPHNRAEVNDFLVQHWFSTDMVVRGSIIDMTQVSGIVAYDDCGHIAGLLTYLLDGEVCELTSLDSLAEGKGLGTALVERLVEIAREGQCSKIVLITTNDNLNAIRFYQKRGFDLVRVYPNAMETARKLKPGIPLVGNHGIPLKHELEFELALT